MIREKNFRQYPEPAICAPGTLNKSAERVGFVKALPGALWKAESSGAILEVLWRLIVASLIFPHLDSPPIIGQERRMISI
jgi:hypothetical protein